MKINYYFAKICKRLKLDKIYRRSIKSRGKSTINIADYNGVLNSKYNPETEEYASLIDRESWNENKEFDLQIIVSVFNGEDYIKACVDSVLNQKTNYKWQLIIINDGSTDKTLEILEKYKDERLKVISQENRGFSGGRNRGLEQMSSRYLMFVDADDLMEDGAIEHLLSFAYENDLDIVEGNFYTFKKNKKRKKSFYSDKIVTEPISSLRGYPWGKVIKTDMFKNIQYPCGYWFEDSIFTFLLYPLTSKCGTVSHYVYSYRKNPQGITNKAKYRIKCLDTVYIMEEVLNSATKLGISFSSEYYEAFLKHCCLSCERMYFMDKEVKIAAFCYLCDLHTKYFACNATDNPVLQKVALSLKNYDYKLFSEIALYCNY